MFAYILLFTSKYKEQPYESRLALNEVVHLPEKLLDIIKEKQKEFVGILRGLIEDLLEKKRSPKSITLLTYSLLGMCTWPYRWFNLNGESTIEELTMVIYKIFMGQIELNIQGMDTGILPKGM